MRVKATQLGFDGLRRIRPGQEFEAPVGKDGKPLKGQWYEPVEQEHQERVPPPKPEKVTKE